MNKKLHVGNLDYTTTEDELQALFAGIGPVVSAVVITDRRTGRSKGFGFVEMETDQAAQEAIERLNNYELGQRNISVSEAHPPRQRPAGDRRRSNRGEGRGRRGHRNGGGRQHD